MAETPPRHLRHQALPMRRLGSGVTHLVTLAPAHLQTLHFVTDYQGTTMPVVALCGAVLHGSKAWMMNGGICRRCRRHADHGPYEVQFFDPEQSGSEVRR